MTNGAYCNCRKREIAHDHVKREIRRPTVVVKVFRLFYYAIVKETNRFLYRFQLIEWPQSDGSPIISWLGTERFCWKNVTIRDRIRDESFLHCQAGQTWSRIGVTGRWGPLLASNFKKLLCQFKVTEAKRGDGGLPGRLPLLCNVIISRLTTGAKALRFPSQKEGNVQGRRKARARATIEMADFSQALIRTDRFTFPFITHRQRAHGTAISRGRDCVQSVALSDLFTSARGSCANHRWSCRVS